MARGNNLMRVSKDFENLVKEISTKTKQTSAEITREISRKIRKP